MAVNAQLLKVLKKHKFKNNDVITYTALNNNNDTKTVTDVANEIYKALMGSNKKDKMQILNAIFDGVYTVVENSSKKDTYGLVDEKNGEYAELEIKLVKDTIEFNTKNAKIKLNFKIGTPEVVEKPSNWVGSKSKAELEKLLQSSKTKSDLEAIIGLLKNMVNTKF